VWVVDTNAANKTSAVRMQPVKAAVAEGQLTILDSGLQQGQLVVVDGAERLRDKQAVNPSMAHQRGGQASGQGAGQGAGLGNGPAGASGSAPKKEQP
jgi:hypothetical protein